MKKIWTIVGIITFVVIVLAGCTWAYLYFASDENLQNNEVSSGDTSLNSGESDLDNEQVEIDMETPLFTSGDYPKVDASLATQPLTDSFMANFTATPIDEIVTDYTNTHPSYIRLIDGEVDLIVVTSPSTEEIEYAKSKNVELEVTPVVNEGFVFLANKENKVNGLTLKEVQDIYTGKITKWSEVGGDDSDIIPYQRPTNSGSQTGMLDLVMDGLEMIAPKTETFEETMAGLIEAIAEYKNSKDAIGYSYYYYATTMYSKDSIKLLAIDGVTPNYETIQNGTYPIGTAYYIVINKSEPKDSNTRKLMNAMLSARGQAVAKEAGYVPVN